MTGPEHYAEAERLLAQAAVHAGIVDRYTRQGAAAITAVEERLAASHIAAAQVHATLALAAATALGVLDRGFDCPDSTSTEAEGWNETLG